MACGTYVLSFIRRERASSAFRVAQIARLVGRQDKDRASAEVKTIASAHITELEEADRRIAGDGADLGELSRACHGNERPDCPILDDLAGSAAGIRAEAGSRRQGGPR